MGTITTGFGKISFLFIRLLLIFILILGNFSLSAEAKKRRKLKVEKLDFIEGSNPDLNLFIKKSSLNLDLSKQNVIEVILRPKSLFNSTKHFGTYTVKLYELNGSDKSFVSAQVVTFARNNKLQTVFLVPGDFETPSKDVQIDVLDSQNNLINSYQETLRAFNIENKFLDDDDLVSDSDCDNQTFGLCQLDYIMENIKFVANPTRNSRTNLVKNVDGTYEVAIPVPRKNFKANSSKTNVSVATASNNQNTTSNNVSGFGGVLSTSEILLGSSNLDFAHFVFNSETKKLHLESDGGVEIAGALSLKAAELSSELSDGSFEFDGTNLYFTANGNREQISLGAQQSGNVEPPRNIQISSGNVDLTSISSTAIGSLQLGKVQYLSNENAYQLDGTTSIPVDSTLVRIVSNGGDVEMTALSQVVAGQNGQMVIIKGTSDTDRIVLHHGDGLSLLGGASMVLGKGDNINLVYDAYEDGGVWMEIGRTNN